MNEHRRESPPSLSSGIPGLDVVLRGGLLPGCLYLVDGRPGSGKTTMALQFLMAGARQGETCLYVTLSESAAELHATAASHGWELSGIEMLELRPAQDVAPADGGYTMYHPSEVELAETTKLVMARVAKLRPSRLVFDSVSEMRLLAETSLRYRRQILALKQHFARERCTVFLLDDRTGGERDSDLYSLAHGVISLDRHSPPYGATRRRIQVTKLRGRAFSEGYHDCVIRHGGLEVFPRLVAHEHAPVGRREMVRSGMEALDALLGGGLHAGSSVLLLGAAGTGKSSVADRFACTASERGERVALFLFDESIDTMLARTAGLGMDLSEAVAEGRVLVRQVDPAQLTPGEFAETVREAVDAGVSLVIIDSLNGYLKAMPDEQFLLLHLHELLTYLGQMQVTTLLLLTQHGLVGTEVAPVDASYLADVVVLLRYFEAAGEVRQAISVIKKRTGPHERTIRELRFGPGLTIGPPLCEFEGVLSGQPRVAGERRQRSAASGSDAGPTS